MKRFVSLLTLVSMSALAGTFGVPTNLNANGSTSNSSVNPPGWIEIFGSTANDDLGDTVHVNRWYIQVTGTTLDVRIFDPGSSGARDFSGTSATVTTFTLLRPTGTPALATVSISDDTTTTDDRLVRLQSTGFVAFNSGSAFTGLTPGTYQLVVSTNNGNEGNFYGIDIRSTTGANAPHYAVYTMTRTSPAANAAGFLVGGNTAAGTPAAIMTPPATAFVDANRGCTFDITNYDGDSTDYANILPVDGSPTMSIALGANQRGVTQSATIEPTNTQSLMLNNYGLWRLSFDPGPTNGIDWSFADFTNWQNNTTTALRNPNNPLRLFMPNGYSPVAGNANAVPPTVPTPAMGVSIISGPNPPVANQTSRLVITIAVRNGSGVPLSNVQFNVGGIPGTALFQGNTTGTPANLQCLINGTVNTACTTSAGTNGNFVSTTRWVRGTLTTPLPVGATGSFRFEVDYSPRSSGLQDLTGAPSTTADTTSWVTFNSSLAMGEKVGPLCNMRVQVGGGVEAPTPARISGVYVNDEGLTFDTGVQLNTVGFRVFTSNEENGKKRNALHEGVIAATEPDTFEPRRYQVPTTTKLTDTYLFIEELQSNGPPHIIASMKVGEIGRVIPPLRLEEKKPRAIKKSSKPNPFTPVTPQTALKLFVSKVGRINVTRAELEAAGLAAGAPIELFHLGQPVDFTWNADNTSFSFNSVPFSTQYTGSAVYVVTTGGSPAPEPEVVFTRLEPKPTTRRIESNAIYYALTPWAESPWFWSLLRSNAVWPTTPSQGVFDLPWMSRMVGTTKVRVKLLGRSGHHHRVDATLNGVSIGSVDFDGATPVTLEGSIPVANLRTNGNQLGLTLTSTAVSPDDQGALGFVYLDWLEVDGMAPEFLRSATVDSIAPYKPELPGSRGADYLIISHGDFLDSARELAELKRQEGLRPVVVDVERAYDTFTSGTFEANAIKALIQNVASNSRKLRYVVLLGDDTVDPRDFMGLRNRSFIPSLDGWDGELGRVPSESKYADLDDDGKPDLAIGRLPVQTVADANVLLDKIGHYPLRNRHASQHVVFVDQRGPNDDDFLARATSMNQSIGTRPNIIDTATGVSQAKQTLTSVLNSGNAASIHFIGHGAPNAWTTRGLWTVNDSAVMTPAPSDTVGFQWSCFAQWYQYLFGPSLGESLLLMREGGVTASFGPSGITNPSGQALLSQAVYSNVFQQQLPLGDAILEAKRALPVGPESSALIDGWNLLGDPAMIPSPLATGRGPWTPHENASENASGNRNKKTVQAAAP